MILTYDAVDTNGQAIHDTVQAGTVKEAVEELRRQGLFVTEIATTKEKSSGDHAPVSDEALADLKLPLNTLVLFTRQMSMLLTSGSALVPALTAVGKQMRNPSHQRMIDLLKENLEAGESLTDALRRFPRVFDPAYAAVIAAGESSATLPKMFSQLANVIGKRRAMFNSIIGALIYPALLLVLSQAILAVMLFFVVPRFADMFKTLGVDVPSTTQILLDAASALRGSWMYLGTGALLLGGGFWYLVRTPSGQQILANVQIMPPVVGKLMSRLIQGRTFRVLGMLLEARVGLLESLDLARKVTRNHRYAELYDALEDSVTRGETLSDPLQASGMVGPSIIQAVRTGEESGRLGESIAYVADVLDEENTELLNVVTKLIEPLILIIMGFIVGTVAISLFMPLFDMTAAIH